MATAAAIPAPVAYAEDPRSGVGAGIPDSPQVIPPRQELASAQRIRVSITITDTPPSARPQSILFGALADPRLRLRAPIPLDVLTEEGNVVVSWNEADEFACGATLGEALDDFSRTVGELYSELNDPNVRLGADLERVRQILNRHIERK